MEYVNTKALRSGEIKSDLVKIEFTGPKIANQGFKPMIREAKFHISELAVVSFLQAREAGKPLVLAPAPILSRFQHHCISYNTAALPGTEAQGPRRQARRPALLFADDGAVGARDPEARVRRRSRTRSDGRATTRRTPPRSRTPIS